MAIENATEAAPSPVTQNLLDWADYWYPLSWKGVLVGGLITAIGAVATITFLLLQWRTTSIREAQSEWRTQNLETQAALAKRDTAAALERIEGLKTEAEASRAAIATANATSDLAKAEAAKANLELERLKAPRSLSGEQQVAIANAILQFAHQEYQVTTFWDEKEPLAFANEIHKALQLAGWHFVKPGEGGSFLLGTLTGIQVWIHPNAEPNVINAANALVEVLNSFGAQAVLMRQNPNNSIDNKISLNVGTKPQTP